MTIQEIAKMAGVSRGTVDRVLHNRGKVKPDIQARIETIIRETGFSPNMAASALKRSGKNVALAALLPPLSNAFYYDVKEGMERAAEHYAQYGVSLHITHLEELSAPCMVYAIEELKQQGIDGLTMTAVNSQQMRNYINRLCKTIPVITYNTDFTESKRLCFVGQDHYCAGLTAGRLLRNSIHKSGKIVPLISFDNILAHTQRIDGLRDTLADCPLDIYLSKPLMTLESDEVAYDVVKNLLKTDQDVTCIFVAGGGQVGAADALANSGKADDILMICYDLLPKTIAQLKAGVVDYTIGQHPFMQGYLPVQLLYEYVALGKSPGQENFFSNIDIRLKENVDFNGIYPVSTIL